MFCRNCGQEIPSDTRYCPKCGANQNESTQTTNQPIIVNVSNINTNTNQNSGIQYPTKSKWAAFILCFLFGGLGFHRFYTGKAGTGILWLLTAGLFGIGWIIDLLSILFGGFRDKFGHPLV